MFQKQNSPKKENVKKTMKPYSRAFMSSYEWTYRVLDIVDFIENNLSSKKEDDSDWKLFQEYCAQYDLNWIVVKKMIEFTVVQVFGSEADVINCEEFKALEFRKDIIGEDNTGKEEKVWSPTAEELACLNSTDDKRTIKNKNKEEKFIDITF